MDTLSTGGSFTRLFGLQVFFVICLVAVAPATGACFHDGQHYGNHSLWQPSPCTICSCHDPVPVCETIQCQDPRCDYAKGQQLQVLDNSCCPVCVDIGRPCQFQGQPVPDKTSWTPSQCVTCVCDDGEVQCSRQTCPPVVCKPGQVSQSLPGQCCPKCLPTGRPCTGDDGERREDGAQWSPLPCVLCVCRDGHPKCLPRHCPRLNCPQGDVLVPKPGVCCPKCRNQHCSHQGYTYTDGELWQPDACTTCLCSQGAVHCTTQTCQGQQAAPCQQDQISIRRPDQCCPQCVQKSGACDTEPIKHYHGEFWNISDCEFCWCNNGNVRCRTLVCPAVRCAQGEVLEHRVGKCCAECVTPPVCRHNGTVFQDGATWDVDACTVCTCDDGQVDCYHKTCPRCPDGQSRVTRPGQCCGHCEKVRCAADCLSCLPQDSAHCTRCRQPGKLLQSGRCGDICREGFYPVANNTCLACHPTCQTCNDGTKYHCKSCPPSLVLRGGQCVRQCGSGYFLRTGQCLACDATCNSCSGPGPAQCVSCARDGQLLLQASCVDRCPPRHYLLGRDCLACPPTCRTCVSDAPECSTCHSHSFLYKGECLSTCPSGYYGDGNSLCQACHPSCLTCSAGSSSSCTTCDVGSTLSNGRCQGTCPRHQYRSQDGRCTDCGDGCKECSPIRGGLSSACTRCDTSNNVAAGTVCRDTCPPATYIRDGLCYGCDDKCQLCEKLGQCTMCYQPFLLSDGHCVQACPERSFSDQTNTCRQCPEHCLTCLSGQVCVSCDSQSYLWRGTCVLTCGQDLVLDYDDRICYENAYPPTVTISGPLLVPDQDTSSLSPSLIRVTDRDTPDHRLSLHLTALPANGQLLLTSKGQEAILGHGDSVSVQDMAQGRLRFVHTDGSVRTGELVFYASDGQLTSESKTLSIMIQPIQPLSVVVNSPLTAVKGGRKTLSPDILDLRSMTTSEVNLRVVDGPRYGDFRSRISDKVIQSFTLNDLHQEEIEYSHHGNSTMSSDMAVLSASDTFQQLSVVLNIQLRIKNSLMPVVVVNNGGQVRPGQRLQISSDLLQVKAIDPASPDVIYTLVPAVNNPKKGEVLMIVPTPESGPGRGWEDLGDGLMGVRMSRFLQRDIDEGRIFYQHQAGQGHGDVFTFEAADMSEPPNVIHNQSFHIRILSDVQEDSSQFAVPTLAPGVRLGMTVLENQVVPITNSHLAYRDPDTRDLDLVYRLTSLLGEDEGTVEHVDFPFKPVLQFTQQDINENRILYRPPDHEIGMNEMEVSFYFVLTDGADDHQLPEQKFTIRIVPVNNMPPKFLTPSPRLTVAEGATVPIPAPFLEVVDSDTAPEDLIVTIVEEPGFGDLERVDRQFVVVLITGDSFPYSEMAGSSFQYRHSGAEGDGEDYIFLSVTDGTYEVGSTITVAVLNVDKSAPVLLPSSSCKINVTEGGTVWIVRDQLAFEDSDDEDADVAISMSSVTAHGLLLVGEPAVTLVPGNVFTQADINSGFLRYESVGEIGSKAVTELLYFNVSDASGNVLPGQVLSVLILPRDNQPPVVTVGPDVPVEEGGEAPIVFPMISIMDIDTPLADLQITVTVPPKFGQLVNTKPAPGSEQAGIEEVSSLTVKDLVNGHLSYFQSDHLGKEPAWDAFLFTVSDGINTSPTHRFNVSIVPINDEPPSIVTEQLFVKEGQAVTLTNASMYVVDLDTPPEDLMLTIILPPTSGTVKRKKFYLDPLSTGTPLKQNSSFFYEDVLHELIVYEHNDDEVTTDMLVLRVTDGDLEDTRQLNIIVGLINDETPRVTINRGLRIKAGSRTTIKSSDLRATDVDSEDQDIVYTVRRDPSAGMLQFRDADGTTHTLSVDGPLSAFTQDDIDRGRIDFVHTTGELTGTLLFKFMLSDTEGNDLIDQDFFITVMEDRFPPTKVSNREFVVKEGGRQKISTDVLSFTDVDSEPGSLVYRLFEGPDLGYLELAGQPGVPVVEFTQSDLAAGSVFYVHTSPSEMYMDQFTFAVTDGSNEIIQTFHITLTPVDDAIPMVVNNGLRVQEGVRKLITEFDLKAIDPDTKEEEVLFTVMEAPLYGSLDLETEHGHAPASRFSMSDVYENRISYMHSGDEQFHDAFTFTVSDGTNDLFTMQSDQPPQGGVEQANHLPLNTPQEFQIDIMPMDDGTPVLQTNLGLNFLEKFESLAGNYITERDLKTVDEDSLAAEVVYAITEPPLHGVVEITDRPGQQVASFTQEDVNKGLIRYMLYDDIKEDLHDHFEFDVMDTKPNVVKGNQFHIRWSRIELGLRAINVSESADILRVPVVRHGNLKQYAIVECHTKAGTALSEQKDGRPGLFDFVQFSGQVQFDEWQDTKMCSILINDDFTYEGPETLYVELSSPTYALLGDTTIAAVTILDEEDLPMIQFEEAIIHVNETDVYVMANLKRIGDLSDTVSVVCSTSPMTATGSSLIGLESGSDFISRGNSNSFRVIFPAGISTATCDVKVIDDSEFETAEQFELHLSDPSRPAVLGPLATAIVIIEGPNDESHVLLSASEYRFSEDAGVVEVEVVREGSDLSHVTTVWCATRLSHPPSATPGVDYAPSSSQITFTPGQISQKCQLTLLDDDYDPRLEGDETFEVFLSSAVGSTLAAPYQATVVIGDEALDVPTFTFVQDSYYVDEKNGSVNATITRLGDRTLAASVICYTRQLSAEVMMDFEERVLTNQSRIKFQPGQRQKNCSAHIVDDIDFEPEEDFQLLLTEPVTEEGLTAQLGAIDTVTVTLTNHDDVPKLQLERSAYSVHEPSVKEQISTVVVRVVRTGADNRTSSVRCSTRDGSAQSGLDYNARSLRITFPPGVREVDFPVDILYNSDVEWHEAFTILLGPEDPEGAIFGPVTTATITILDNEVSGSLVLPAPPVVVSLLHYDDAEQGSKTEPSPGYPLVCINPCDVHYPTYTVTHTLCDESGINASAILYQWEVALPPDPSGSRSPFVQVSDRTLFTSTTDRVLDSVYFRSYFRVRCMAQPLHANGNPGVPLRSAPVTIGRSNGICNPPSFGGAAQGYHAQSFLTTLNYVRPDSDRHPNTIHIRVEIPHQDGMLPLVSTLPLHNIRLLLSHPVYRQQHVCSNVISPEERAPLLDEGFLGEVTEDEPFPFGPGYDFPYQFDPDLREHRTLALYRHLDLKRCIWAFDAFYHMTELVDICGGRVVSDFTIKDRTQTHLTVRVPLHVSYLFAAAPVGWTSMEHRTEMELAFYYSTVLWRSGLETEGRLGGKLQIKRILIGQDGKLVIEFRTQAKFRGVYVVSHHTAPGVESRVLAPKSLAISFDLKLVWSQHTFDSPHQMWQATSRYNLKDYTGMYVIELIPCAVTPTQAYVSADPLPCTAGKPQRYEVPLSFQQTNRPVPVVYSLDTLLQLTNNLNMFLLDPSTDNISPDDWDFNGAFSEGQNLYGRVLWNPSQDLEKAYKLTIEKVYLCTGSDGYIPTYDPTGDIYNEGPQYGCIQPSSRLLFRFLILDRENPDVTQTNFQDIPFDASFAADRQELSPLLDMSGVDGFIFNVDPLYKVDSGHQWYLQVIYLIGPAQTPLYRHRREASATSPYPASTQTASGRGPPGGRRDPASGLSLDRPRNGTNMQHILINRRPPPPTTSLFYPIYVILPLVLFVVGVACVTLVIVCVRKRRRRKRKNCETLTVRRNNLGKPKSMLRVSVTSVNAPSLSVSQADLNSVASKAEAKNKAVAAKCNIIKAKDVNILAQQNVNVDDGTEV